MSSGCGCNDGDSGGGRQVYVCVVCMYVLMYLCMYDQMAVVYALKRVSLAGAGRWSMYVGKRAWRG